MIDSNTIRTEAIRLLNQALSVDRASELSRNELPKLNFLLIDTAPEAARNLGLTVTELTGEQIPDTLHQLLKGERFSIGQEVLIGERSVALLKVVLDLTKAEDVGAILIESATINGLQAPEYYVVGEGENIYTAAPIIEVAFITPADS